MKLLRLWSGFLVSTLLIVLVFAGPAAAHDPGTTVIEIEASGSGFDAQVDVPIGELGDALGLDVATDTFGISQQRDVLVEYVETYLYIGGINGEEWTTTIGRLTVIRSDGRQYLRVPIAAEPDAGAAVEQIVLRSQLIVEDDSTHEIIITVIAGDGSARITGILDAETSERMVSLSGDVDASFLAIVRHGFDHVLEGADHLLFLLALLLPAPLISAAGRWRTAPGFWRALKRVLHVATAFMIGHSISLAAAALGIISVPTRPVEIVIAVSVAVSALHALRPLTQRGDIYIAAGFGLVHGVAFAEILQNYGLEGGNTLVTLLAFNLGVEAAQLIAILVVFPSLWLLSQTQVYSWVRPILAGAIMVLAAAWVVERIWETANPFSSLEEAAINHLLTVGLGLGVVAALVWVAAGGFSGAEVPDQQQALPR